MNSLFSPVNLSFTVYSKPYVIPIFKYVLLPHKLYNDCHLFTTVLSGNLVSLLMDDYSWGETTLSRPVNGHFGFYCFQVRVFLSIDVKRVDSTWEITLPKETTSHSHKCLGEGCSSKGEKEVRQRFICIVLQDALRHAID